MNFIRQIFQDVDGSFSAKRTAFLIFVLMFVLIAGAIFFKAVPAGALPVVTSTQEKLVDLIKWIGGFILGEQASKFAPNKPGV